MVSSNQTRSFFRIFTRRSNLRGVEILESLVIIVANLAVSRKSCCAAVRNNPEPYRDREQIEKVRQLDPLEFLRAVGAAGAHHLRARRRCQQTRRPAHFFIVTSVMPFTRLLASMKLPSRVTDVLRTMFPPPGIAQLWNFAVLGSKRTTVFGVDPDSLYQMMSLIAEMP